MNRRCRRAALVLVACGILPGLFGQESPSPGAVDSAVYRAFFQEAAHHAGSAPIMKTDPPTLNGQPAELNLPSIQDALGVTDREVQAVIDASAGCEADLIRLDNDARTLVFESRLRAAEERPSGALDAQLKELDAKRIRIVLDYVQRMKSSLGAERFKIVDDYIRARANTGSFFPGTGPKKKL